MDIIQNTNEKNCYTMLIYLVIKYKNSLQLLAIIIYKEYFHSFQLSCISYYLPYSIKNKI